MTDQAFLQVQVLELRRMLGRAKEGSIVAKQLRERLTDAEEELERANTRDGQIFAEAPSVLPRTAIFLRGGGVQGSDGISASLAGEALLQYERMFTAQAIHDERNAARKAGRQRRHRGAPTPGLLFTGTPRGSFGLEFVPKLTGDHPVMGVHAVSLVSIADAIYQVANAGDTLDDAIKNVPPPVLQPMKQFIKALSDHGASIRIAFADKPGRSLTADQIKVAADRLERDVTQDVANIKGTFRGVTRDSGVFDLRTEAEDVLTGTVVDSLTEDDLERIDRLTNEACIATLQKTIVRRLSGTDAVTYVLLDATALETG
jgi:hypothetical protein